MNPFLEAQTTARAICARLDWATGDDQAEASKALRGLRTLLADTYRQAERQGCLRNVVATMNRHVAEAPVGRVRETVAMLVNGYSDMVTLYNK